MKDHRSANDILQQVRNEFQGCKHVIVFIDRREHPEFTDELREYVGKHKGDSFLMAGYIGDLSNDDRSDDRWKKFSPEQYDRLHNIFSIEDDPDYPVHLVVIDGDNITHLSCAEDAEVIWATAMLSFRNKMRQKGPYYLIERSPNLISETMVTPRVLKFTLFVPILIGLMLMLLMTIPFGYVLYIGIFIAVLAVSLSISEVPDHRIFGRNLTFKDISAMMSTLMPGSGAIMHNRKRGTVILVLYFAYLFAVTFVAVEFEGRIPGWGNVWILWAIFSCTLFEYISLTSPFHTYIERHRFAYSSMMTDFVVKMFFFPIVGYIAMIALTAAKMGLASAVPILAFAVPMAYFIIGWIRHPMKKVYLSDDMLMENDHRIGN